MVLFRSEVELAKPVVAWLENLKWDVYQEVNGIDIVAVQGPIVWVIECKRGNTLALLDQLFARIRFGRWGHFTSCATPLYPSRAFEAALKSWGIGHLCVGEQGGPRVSEDLAPQLYRTAGHAGKLRAGLRPEHKTHLPAGSPTGGGWSPFKETCENLRRYVGAHPGVPLKDLIATVKTHYRTPASARASLAKWIKAGQVPGLRLDQGNVWPAQEA